MLFFWKSVLIVFLCVGMAFKGFAQFPQDSIKFYIPKLSLAVLPSGWIDPFHAVLGIRADFRLSSTMPMAIGLEMGALLPRFSAENSENPLKFKNGILVKPALRYYYTGDPNEGMLFAELQGMYKFMATDYEDWVLFDLPSGAGSYERFTKIGLRHSVYGLNVLMGVKSNISRKKKNLFFELFGGTGIRYRDFTMDQLPENGTIRDIESDSPGNFISRGWRLSIQGGIRFGWNF
jgi:hypothetical protein